ncbi:MAG TPA: DNA primase [Vicinamibacterales bacterium]|nr:DNA primase [Vicinamibacterales bacterium]
MALFPQTFIDDLKLQANIVQVIQEYVSLKRVGRTYKGLCPFHGEKTPSFHVDPEKGFFHCFGCNAGGDVFKFLELHEKVGFADAVRMLALKTGLSLPEPTDDDPAGRQDAALREALLKMHEMAAAYFAEQLAGPAGGRARQQLRDRDVSAKTVEQLCLGYAPQGRDGLKSRLLKQGFSQGLLVQSGLVVQRDNGEVVDRFRNRLMIPICRDTGSVIAFGGRSMEADQVPKYLNSPETPIYSKGRTLYGLNLSKAAVRKLGYAVMVEGYFDYAQVHQTQAAPVVASCGTALTPAQAQLLRRFTTRIVLSFDPDAAGQGAAVRSCELLVAEGFDVNVLALNKGEDPDTFIRRNGPDAYRERLKTSRPYLEYLLDQAAAGVDFAQDEARRQFLGRMLQVAAKIPEATARDQFADRIAHKARVTEDVVRAEIRKAAVHRRTEVTTREIPSFGQLKPAEKGLLWALVHNSRQGFSALEELEPEDLAPLAARTIFELARSLRESTNADGLPSALLQRLSTENAQVFAAVAAMDSAPALSPVECARTIRKLRWQRERAAIQREIDRLQQLGSGAHNSEIDVLLRKKNDLGLRIEQFDVGRG